MVMIRRCILLATLLAASIVTARANEAKPYVRVEIAYANQSSQQRLDLYTPVDGSGPFPLVMWIHGGNFYAGDKSAMPFVIRGKVPTKPNERPYQIQVPDVIALTKMGYAVVSLNYRLGSGSTWTDAALAGIRDGKTAVRYLRANAGTLRLDPARFAVWGNSAGAIIAAMLGVTGDQKTPFDEAESDDVSGEVQAVIAWYGVAEAFPPPLQYAPYIALAKNLPPFLIASGDLDAVVKPELAAQVHDALVRRGALSTLTIVKGAGHEDPLFRKTQMQPAFAFLQRYLGR